MSETQLCPGYVHVVPDGGPSWTTACGKRVDPGIDARQWVPDHIVPASHWVGIHGVEFVSCPDCRESLGIPRYV